MVRPLTKRKKNGEIYTRPKNVDEVIDEAIALEPAALQIRLEVADYHDPNYLYSECLVHLVRKAVRSDDQKLIGMVLPRLLSRCEANLQAKIFNGDIPDANGLREDILGDFSEKFASDGKGTNPNELDFFEVHFNSAFRTFRIDRTKVEHNRIENFINFSKLSVEDEGQIDDVLASLSTKFQVPATQENALLKNRIWNAINALPAEERNAVVLCYYLGYKVESEDSGQVTAATICNCSGRTVRNRLSRAAARLKPLKEELWLRNSTPVLHP